MKDRNGQFSLNGSILMKWVAPLMFYGQTFIQSCPLATLQKAQSREIGGFKIQYL